MASFTPHGQSNPSLCIDQCLDPPIVRIAWIQALKVGDVNGRFTGHWGYAEYYFLVGKLASSGERVKVHLTPKYFFRLNNSLHLFEMHCAFVTHFSPNLDFFTGCKSYEIWPSSVPQTSK